MHKTISTVTKHHQKYNPYQVPSMILLHKHIYILLRYVLTLKGSYTDIHSVITKILLYSLIILDDSQTINSILIPRINLPRNQSILRCIYTVKSFLKIRFKTNFSCAPASNINLKA